MKLLLWTVIAIVLAGAVVGDTSENDTFYSPDVNISIYTDSPAYFSSWVTTGKMEMAAFNTTTQYLNWANISIAGDNYTVPTTTSYQAVPNATMETGGTWDGVAGAWHDQNWTTQRHCEDPTNHCYAYSNWTIPTGAINATLKYRQGSSTPNPLNVTIPSQCLTNPVQIRNHMSYGEVGNVSCRNATGWHDIATVWWTLGSWVFYDIAMYWHYPSRQAYYLENITTSQLPTVTRTSGTVVQLDCTADVQLQGNATFKMNVPWMNCNFTRYVRADTGLATYDYTSTCAEINATHCLITATMPTPCPTSRTLSVLFAPYLNVSLWHEETGAPFLNNATLAISGPYNANVTTDLGSWFLNDSLLAIGSYRIEYSSPGYTLRSYTFDLDLATTLTQIRLYFMNSSVVGDPITVNVYDQDNRRISNAHVRLYRWYPASASWQMVQEGVTDVQGRTHLYAIMDTVYYKFMVDYGGTTVYEGTATYLYDTDVVLYITLGTYISARFEKSMNIEHQLTFANNRFRFYYNDLNANTSRQGCVAVYRQSLQEYTFINRSCSSSTSAILYVNVANTSGTTYKAEAYTEIYASPASAVVLETLYATISGAVATYGTMGLLVTAFLLILLAVGVGYWSLKLAVLLTPTALMVATIAGLVPISWTVIVGLFGLAFILLVFMDKGDSNNG